MMGNRAARRPIFILNSFTDWPAWHSWLGVGFVKRRESFRILAERKFTVRSINKF